MSFFRKKTNAATAHRPPSAPPDTRIYAVGDVHGRLDLLQQLQHLILEDARSCDSRTRKVIVYIGDYIDRGTQSKQVIDLFINNKIDGFEHIFIKGNHEYALLNFLDNAKIGEMWLAWGGYATVQSYGISIGGLKERDMESLKRALKDAIPQEHLQFLQNLALSHTEGDYLFVHAGIKPGVPIEKQSDDNLMMIREEFIYSSYPSPDKTIVFGHTIFEHPFVNEGKICIDTGAYATGKLTSVVLEGTSVRFIST